MSLKWEQCPGPAELSLMLHPQHLLAETMLLSLLSPPNTIPASYL